MQEDILADGKFFISLYPLYPHSLQIIVHSCLGTLVVVIACILSAGYALTCRNMYLVVEKEIR